MCYSMNDNYKVSIERISEVLPEEYMNDSFKNEILASGARISQVVLNKNNDEAEYYMTSVHDVYSLVNGTLNQYSKKDVKSVEFIKGTPDGKLKVTFNDGTEWKLEDVVYGRAFDFTQDIKPKVINHAGYDNTIRGEFPQLLDPDHAEEIDRLRKWMQDGHISHYEYDDANPVYPKAGK